MAPRLLLSLLLLAATALIAWAQGIGSSPSDCCLKYSKKSVPKIVVKSYSLQGPESGCMIPAVVIITKRNKKICVSPMKSNIQGIIQKLKREEKKDNKKEEVQHPRSRSKRQMQQQVF